MTTSLTAPVGRGGTNRVDDIILVQQVLLRRGFRIGTADGKCGRRTQAAIDTFQRGFMQAPDGRIDPGGATWRRLSDVPEPIAPVDASLTRLVPIPDRSTINGGLAPVNNTFMRNLLGNPRETYSSDCQPVTEPRLRRSMQRANVGPFAVTGLRPAVESLATVLSDVRSLLPEVYQALGSAGMFCCRYVRGSTSSISNHSWGTAIDLTLNGKLDVRGNDMVQHGLCLIAPVFNRHGWYWGASFRTEDAMHFEASRSLVESWRDSL